MIKNFLFRAGKYNELNILCYFMVHVQSVRNNFIVFLFSITIIVYVRCGILITYELTIQLQEAIYENDDV